MPNIALLFFMRPNMKIICIPKIYIRHVRSEDRRICFQVEMEPHEMRMIYISEY